ncbi:MAG: 2-dehydropantoate 2-reductase [Actinobacteria bacterium]|nr:2-dehydropantoate 2-reductase [Actinomycetota bacterium]
MKIAVVGAGAMGSVYAAILGDAGNEVWAVDTWAEHVDAIRRDGLTVEGASGARTVRIGATTDPTEVGVCDLIVISTKAMHVDAAAESALPLVGPDTVVLPIQNGLGSADRIAACLGEERVAIGVVGGFGASIVGPGHAHHNGWELVRLGERHGPVTERIRRIAQVWEDAGFRVQVYDDVDQLVWEKLVCNVCFSGTCTVLEWPIRAVLENEASWRVASSCATEAYEVARARGIALSFDDPVAYVRAFGEKIPDARPSMLLDFLAGRPCEIDVINGAIPPAAREAGLTAPVNEVVTALVEAKSPGP